VSQILRQIEQHSPGNPQILGVDAARRDGVHLGSVGNHSPFQLPRLACEEDPHLALVAGIGAAEHEAAALETLDSARMPRFATVRESCLPWKSP